MEGTGIQSVRLLQIALLLLGMGEGQFLNLRGRRAVTGGPWSALAVLLSQSRLMCLLDPFCCPTFRATLVLPSVVTGC